MHSIKKTLLAAVVVLGHLSSYVTAAEELTSYRPSLEWRLQRLMSEEETKRLHSLFHLYWDWRMKEYPDEASFLGYPGQYGQWPDLSQEAIDRRHHFTAQLLQVLNSVEASHLNESDKVSQLILKRVLENDQANTQFGGHFLMVNQMYGTHLFVPFIIEIMPKQTIQDYENILSRLSLIPVIFKQTIDLLDKGIELGITPPRAVLYSVPQQILNQIVENPLVSSLLNAFKNFPPSIDADTQSRLLNEAQIIYQNRVVPALEKLYSYVTEKYIPNCRQSIAFTDVPNGQNWYTHLVQSLTTTDLSPQEIHTIGLKEVQRIHANMLSVIQSTGFEGSYEEFLHFLKTDPQFFYSNREELLHGYQTLTRQIESKLPKLFNTLPSLPFEVIPIPAYSEESQIAAYYSAGSITDKRPGYFYINTSHPEIRFKWEMEPLSLHEAVPGHHLQITLAQELQDLPDFRKNADFTAYIEGWGLYAESLGTELGCYRDPYSNFGRLTYEMLRAIRLVVDTGMHAMGWSRQQAIDCFRQYVGMSDHEIEAEVDRYLVLPAQALSYKIGELKIQELRRLATERLGDQFDIRLFHQAWLEQGTVPLDVAEQHIHDWIQQSLQVEDENTLLFTLL
jgi:uncharacterized protein (DUF885 family)